MTQTLRLSGLFLTAALLAACSGSSDIGEDVIDDDTFDGDGLLLDGTEEPSSSASIERYDGDQEVSLVSYDESTDVFTVNNLPFDGSGAYDRDDIILSVNGFNVYENNNDTPIREYKALHSSSTSGKTSVSIVKTGSYIDHGFGGFVYARNGSVKLPTSGQAVFAGDYAGLRTSDTSAVLQYVAGNAYLEVDFEDLDSSNAVEGYIENRQVYDTNGNAVDSTVPTIILATGGITQAGEIVGSASSFTENEDGSSTEFETGNYYAVIAGKNADEIAGVIVIQQGDVEETGGFFAYEVE